MNQQRVFIFYHYPCTDGAYAALAVWLSKKEHCDITFFPHKTTEALVLPHAPDAEVFVLDYCGPKGFLAKCVQMYQKVHYIDHHESAKSEIVPGLHTLYDLERSGCMLAYTYCSPEITPDLLRIYQYVQDNDLWRHALPNSKEFTAGLRNEYYDFNFAEYPEMLETMQFLDFDQLIESGRHAIEKQNATIDFYVKNSHKLHIAELDIDVQYVEIDPMDTIVKSQLGHKLAESCGLGAIGFKKDQYWKISIRGFNCVRISKHYNGGGHDGAAGFVLTKDPMKIWGIRIK